MWGGRVLKMGICTMSVMKPERTKDMSNIYLYKNFKLRCRLLKVCWLRNQKIIIGASWLAHWWYRSVNLRRLKFSLDDSDACLSAIQQDPWQLGVSSDTGADGFGKFLVECPIIVLMKFAIWEQRSDILCGRGACAGHYVRYSVRMNLA